MEDKICATISLRLWCTLKGIYSTSPPPFLWEGERIKKKGGGGERGAAFRMRYEGTHQPPHTPANPLHTYITDITLQYMKFTRSCDTPLETTPKKLLLKFTELPFNLKKKAIGSTVPPPPPPQMPVRNVPNPFSSCQLNHPLNDFIPDKQ